MAKIHSTAIVDPRAELDEDVEVGPYTQIGPKVRIAKGTVIGSHCLLEGRTTIGKNNKILQFNSLGCLPQDKKYHGEDTALEIGDDNTIHGYCTISIGTQGDVGVTRIGNDNWIMAYVHVAHDVQLGDHIIIANYTGLAGHVHVDDHVVIGGLSGLHQFVHVGSHAMIGFSSAVSQDVPPFITVDGNPAKVHGTNIEGMRRRGFSRERIANIKTLYRLIYRENLTLNSAQEKIRELPFDDSDSRLDAEMMLDFLQNSQRGIVR